MAYTPQAPGPKTPDKYTQNGAPAPGPRYGYWGEQPGWLYDPWTDTYKPDPKSQEEYLESQGYGKPKEPGVWDQTKPILATVGAYELAKGGAQGLLGLVPSTTATTTAPATTAATGNATGGLLSTGAGGAGAGGNAAAASAITVPAGETIPAGYTGVATAADGSTIAAPTSEVGAAGGIGAWLGVAGMAYLYGSNTYEDAKPILEGKGKTENWVDTALDSNLISGWINPMLKPILGKSVGGLLFGGKSTEDYQKERWGKMSPGVQQLYSANHPENDSGVWETGKYAGEKWTFDKAKDLARDDPSHFIAVLGNFETFGDAWAHLSLDQQKQIVSRLVDEDLYTSDKGDVLIKDEERALAIRDEVLGTPPPEEEEENKNGN